MVPEISHRCPACGASVRDFGERAMFCPECGKALADSDAEAAPETDATSAEVKPTIVSWPAQSSAEKNIEAEGAAAQVSAREEPSKDPSPEKPRPGARERTREKLHKASSLARGAIEDNVKRVEKLQHVSSVMLEEATYDPSLRFVLVALGLFVIFVILLIVSKLMG